MTTEQEDVLRFWLDEVGPERWYKGDDALDAEIRQRFEALWRRAAHGDHEDWLLTPRGSLAFLIVLDQFPRNMFRGTAEAFSTDHKALAAAKLAIDHGHDRAVPEPERRFFYMPLMHSEVPTDQDHCVRLITMNMPETGEGPLEHAQKHREVIRRFGRFPARNAPLGRHETGAEREYRESGGYLS